MKITIVAEEEIAEQILDAIQDFCNEYEDEGFLEYIVQSTNNEVYAIVKES